MFYSTPVNASFTSIPVTSIQLTSNFQTLNSDTSNGEGTLNNENAYYRNQFKISPGNSNKYSKINPYKKIDGKRKKYF